jgi:hypothetical protein
MLKKKENEERHKFERKKNLMIKIIIPMKLRKKLKMKSIILKKRKI